MKAIVVVAITWRRRSEESLLVTADGRVPTVFIVRHLRLNLHRCQYLTVFKICSIIMDVKVNKIIKI